jgi:anti-sigma B factor antagonist
VSISERHRGDVVILDLIGPIAGREAAGVVAEAVRRQGRGGTQTVVMNLARVRSVDRDGMGALIEGDRAMREAGGEMRLASLNARIRQLMVHAGVLTAFDTFDSVEEAVEGPIPAYSRAPHPPLPGVRPALQRLFWWQHGAGSG